MMIEQTHTNNSNKRHEFHRGARQRAQRRTSEPVVSDWTPDQESVKKMERSVVDYMTVATKNMQSRHRDMNIRSLLTPETSFKDTKPSRRCSMSLVSNNGHERHCAGAARNPPAPRYPELRKEAYVHESLDDYFLNKNVREMIEHNRFRKGTGKKFSRQISEPALLQEKRYDMSAEDPDTSKVDRLLLATKDAFDKFMDGFTEEQEEEDTLQDVHTSDGKLLQTTKDMLDKFIGGFVVERNMSENVTSHVSNWTKFQGFGRQDSITAKMFQRLAVR